MTQVHVPTDQSGHIIERLENGMKLFFSERIGRDFGNPAGGWTEDRKAATVFTAYEAENFLTHGLAGLAPVCKVVAL